jgi:hypothetical protein
VRPAASPRSPRTPGRPSPRQRCFPDHCSLSGYARSCSSASPRGFAPSPGSQQSSYGSGLGPGIGSYGAPGVAGLGVPGSPSFLNGSTATSPFASECPLPTEGRDGPGEAEWDSALHPARGKGTLPTTSSLGCTLSLQAVLTPCDLSMPLNLNPITPGFHGSEAKLLHAPLAFFADSTCTHRF